jgi:hypothetical protein
MNMIACDDVFSVVCLHLDLVSICKFKQVNKYFYDIINPEMKKYELHRRKNHHAYTLDEIQCKKIGFRGEEIIHTNMSHRYEPFYFQIGSVDDPIFITGLQTFDLECLVSNKLLEKLQKFVTLNLSENTILSNAPRLRIRLSHICRCWNNGREETNSFYSDIYTKLLEEFVVETIMIVRLIKFLGSFDLQVECLYLL